MRVVVTGAAGFLGSHLCARLLDAGHDVLGVDDLSTGRRANLDPIAGHPRFALVVHDLTTPIRLDGERIFHLACPASPVHYQRDPIRTVRTAFLGTLHALEEARRTGARLLLASTSEVYGDPEVHPQPESYLGRVRTTGPRACYDEGKRVAETLCADFHRAHGTEVRIARIFNTYGPNMAPDDGRVVRAFVDQALQGAPLTVFGDGSATRSFCYVDDLVRGLLALIDAPAVGPVNLGNPEEHTIAELAAQVLRLTGSRSELRFLPAREDDPVRRCPDIALARSALGWAPQVSLEDGLLRTIRSLGG